MLETHATAAERFPGDLSHPRDTACTGGGELASSSFSGCSRWNSVISVCLLLGIDTPRHVGLAYHEPMIAAQRLGEETIELLRWNAASSTGKADRGPEEVGAHASRLYT
jgi:hypothetical protein